MKKLQNLKSESPLVYTVSSVIFIIFCIIFSAYPIAMVIIGSNNQMNCPTQRLIPIWLIVSGSTAFLIVGLSIVVYLLFLVAKRNEKSLLAFSIFSGCLSVFLSIVALFQFAWFITGNVWVYSIYRSVQFTDPLSSSTYCDKTTYLFTFWTMTVTYILIGLGIIIGCCIGICSCLCGSLCLLIKEKK